VHPAVRGADRHRARRASSAGRATTGEHGPPGADDAGHLAASLLTGFLRPGFSPGFYDQVVDSFGSHGFHGRIPEFEYLTSALFTNDPVARADIAEGRAFSVAFATRFDPVPEGFLRKEIDPVTLIPVHLFWRRGAPAAAGSFLAAALAVSESEGRLAPIRGSSGAPRGRRRGAGPEAVDQCRMPASTISGRTFSPKYFISSWTSIIPMIIPSMPASLSLTSSSVTCSGVPTIG
jgi:hypothetical protein